MSTDTSDEAPRPSMLPDDLLLLSKVADHVHSWICEQPREPAPVDDHADLVWEPTMQED